MTTTTIRSVSFSTLVRAEPGRVYDAIATAEGLDGWFTKGASVDARPGGSIQFRWKDWGLEGYTGENGGAVLEAERPKRFAFQWRVDSGKYETTVEIDLKPHEAGTVVQLLEHGYESGSEGSQEMLNRAYGWAQALTLMKFFVEHGVTY